MHPPLWTDIIIYLFYEMQKLTYDWVALISEFLKYRLHKIYYRIFVDDV